MKVELERTVAALRALPGARVNDKICNDGTREIYAVLDYGIHSLSCRPDGTFRVQVHFGLPSRYDAWKINNGTVYYDGTEEGTRHTPSWLFFRST